MDSFMNDKRNQSGFGVIITCCPSDLHFAKGCLASVRYFMPDVPICLLFDGKMRKGELGDFREQVYILNRDNIKDHYLRNHSFGFGITKMVAFWESPFERFLLIDADTCCWGDIRKNVDLQKYDMVVDKPLYQYDVKAVNQWFFDTKKLANIDSHFDPMKYADRFFGTGVLFSRKNVFDIEWYKALMKTKKSDPELFFPGEMGLLVYMIFKSVDDEKLLVESRELQHICSDFTADLTRDRFPFKNGLPEVIEIKVIHFTGHTKPYSCLDTIYHQPMTHFREQFYRISKPSMSNDNIKNLIKAEEAHYSGINKIWWVRTLKRVAKKIIRGL